MHTINQLKSLVALAKVAHFRLAAESIGLTQPALTQNIQRVEDYYDVQLFIRERGRVSVTSYGEVVVAAAVKNLNTLEQLNRDVAQMRNLEIGELVIGVDSYMASSLMGFALAELRIKKPKFKFQLRTGPWESMSKLLLNEEIDIYFGMPPPFPSPLLEIEAITVPSPLVLCNPGHPLAQSNNLALADLIEYPIISPIPPSWYVSWAKEQVESFNDLATVMGPVIVETDNLAVAKMMTTDKLSLIAALPSDVRREVASAELLVMKLDNWPNLMEGGFATKRGRVISPAADLLAQEFIAIVEREMKKIKTEKQSGTADEVYREVS